MQLPFPLAEEPDQATREKGRLLFAGETDFVKGVVAMDGLPPADRIEVCFAGRSNVGKSSLINALTGRKGLARASNTPGRTQEINFFTAGEEHYLVDLPGYGFANAPLAVVEKWQRLLKRYLSGRQNLRRAFVLVDHRHGVKPVDEEIMSLLDSSAVTFQCVLTKEDKVKAKDRERILDQVREKLSKHPAAFPELIVTSSEKGDGIEKLRSTIATLVLNNKDGGLRRAGRRLPQSQSLRCKKTPRCRGSRWCLPPLRSALNGAAEYPQSVFPCPGSGLRFQSHPAQLH